MPRNLDFSSYVCAEAAKRYLAGETVQIIAPTKAEVRKLNQQMQSLVNPPAKDIPDILYHGETLRENDRVAILVNDRDQNCSNGDLGTLHISDDPYSEYKLLATETADKRTPTFLSCGREQKLALAYAMTVHKSQGSQYDTVIMPLSVHSRHSASTGAKSMPPSPMSMLSASSSNGLG